MSRFFMVSTAVFVSFSAIGCGTSAFNSSGKAGKDKPATSDGQTKGTNGSTSASAAAKAALGAKGKDGKTSSANAVKGPGAVAGSGSLAPADGGDPVPMIPEDVRKADSAYLKQCVDQWTREGFVLPEGWTSDATLLQYERIPIEPSLGGTLSKKIGQTSPKPALYFITMGRIQGTTLTIDLANPNGWYCYAPGWSLASTVTLRKQCKAKLSYARNDPLTGVPPSSQGLTFSDPEYGCSIVVPPIN